MDDLDYKEMAIAAEIANDELEKLRASLETQVQNALRGSGGGSGKGGSESADNTLRSKARARLLELVSEGECEGLVDGLKSVYFDETPVQNADGSFNFKNVILEEHKGLPDEGYFTGQSGVETPVSVEAQVKVSLGPVVRSVVEQNATALRVITRIPALARQNDEGAIKTASVSYAIDVQPNGGAWTQVVLKEIRNEKTTSPYQIAHYIPLPADGAPWNVRMRRITADSTDIKLQNDTWWESYVILVEGKFTYPHSAIVSLEVNAEDMGSSLPPRRYKYRGLKTLVPTNYDPIARTYAGIWDGTFKRAWHSNPCWVFYDLLSNDRYGLGEFVEALGIDKWSLYAISQYSDVMVPSGYLDEDGDPILEPRFSFNGTIDSAQDAWLLLQQVTAAWRGMAYWSLGQAFATADMPADPFKLVTPANVIGGHFEYSSTGLKARHSVAIVNWNDPADLGRQATEVVINDAMMAKFGWREKPMQLIGCTSRGQAHRMGKWALDTEENETETVTYMASWDHAEVRPGHIVAVADPRKANARFGGRIVANVGALVTIDSAFVPSVGETYSLMIALPDGTLATREIESFSGADLILESALPATAAPNAMFIITGTDITPRLFRVLAVEETEKNIFKVTALFHDPNKYARVEQDILFDPLPYTRPSQVSYAPTGLDVVESGYVLNGETRTFLTLSWTPSPESAAIGFRVSVETPSGWTSLPEVKTNSIDIPNIEAGDYIFHVSAVTYGGIVSAEATTTFTALGPTGLAFPTISGLELADRPGQSTFIGRDVEIAWENNFASTIDPSAPGATPAPGGSPHYKHNTLTIREKVSNTLLRSQRVIGESFLYSFEQNLADSLNAGLTKASRSLRFELTLTDVFDRTTTASILEVSNALPVAPSVSATVVGQIARISWPVTGEIDIAGTKVWIETNNSFNPELTAPKFDGPGNLFSFAGLADTTYYVRVGSYDAFSSTGLNVSAAQTFTLGSFVGEINEEFSQIPGYLFGDGEGSLYSKFVEINGRLEELAALTVDVETVGHVSRMELKAELSQNSARFLSQVTVVANEVSALTSRLTTLESTVADGSVVAGVIEDLEALADVVSAQATALTEVGAQVGDITAGARWAMQAIVAPSGITARFAMMVRVSDSATYIESGILIDIITVSPGVYTSRIAFKTDQLVVTDGIHTANALTFEDGILKILAARMGRIDSPDGVSYIDLGPDPEIHLEST